MAEKSTINGVSDGLIRLEHKHNALDTSHQLLSKDVARNKEELTEIAVYFKYFMKVVISLVTAAVIGFIVQGGLV